MIDLKYGRLCDLQRSARIAHRVVASVDSCGPSVHKSYAKLSLKRHVVLRLGENVMHTPPALRLIVKLSYVSKCRCMLQRVSH